VLLTAEYNQRPFRCSIAARFACCRPDTGLTDLCATVSRRGRDPEQYPMTPIRSRLLRQLREATKAASGELPISSDSRVTSSSASRRRLLQAGASLAVAPLSSALAATGAREAAPVAVIGGGLAGLSAAHALATRGRWWSVAVS
jgi:NADPH-dependent 2,4-dienoyl-CoA reductase/sulfur reductase-like enzyme